jgi:pilus assembly protein CpaB
MGSRFIRMGGGASALGQRERLFVIGGGTLLFALITVGLMIVYSNQTVQAGSPAVAQRPVSEETVFDSVVLVVPAENIPQGAKLSAASLREITWPRDGIPEGAVRDMKDAREMFAKASLAANQPIPRSALSASPLQQGISDLLPPGHRAVTIEVDATSGVEGWATAGAHVDVLLTYLDQSDNTTKTRVAVENAVVLSFNGIATAPTSTENSGSIKSASTVTLAVSFDDSLKMQTARAMGRISLSLRNEVDGKSMGDRTFAANEWDKTQKKQGPTRAVPKGFARFSDSKGNEKQFILRDDKKWWGSQDEE